MKKIFAVIFISCFVFVSGQIVNADEGLTKITEHVYSYLDAKDVSAANSFGANAGIIIGKDAIAVVDTLVSSNAAQKFIKDIRKISDKPIKYVINTHEHFDHTFGNADFAKLGAVIIAHEKAKAAMEKGAENTLKNAKDFGLTDENLAGTQIAYPALTFSDKMQIDLGGVKIELLYIEYSHTEGSIFLYLPDEKLLFAGDGMFVDVHPFMGEGDLEGWIESLEYIESIEADKIIPGHGPLSTKKDVSEMKDYLIFFDKKAKELAALSNDPEYIAAEMIKILPKRSRSEWLIKANIQMKYLKAN